MRQDWIAPVDLAGWVAQYEEHMGDTEQKITRPKQIYTGYAKRDYVPVDER